MSSFSFGTLVQSLVLQLQQNTSQYTEYFAETVNYVIENTLFFIDMLPTPLLIAFLTLISWILHQKIRLTLVVCLALCSILYLGYWREAMQTLVLTIYSTFFSVILGVPIGIAAGHRPWLARILKPVTDLMQTLPTFVYLIPVLILFGLGMVPGMLATVIASIPVTINLTQHGIRNVPSILVEAGKALGATKWQLLWRIELPSAMSTIMVGINQCVMLCLSMTVIAAIVGAEGLGTLVLRALNTINAPLGFEAGAAIVMLAVVLDRLTRMPDRKTYKS